MIRGLLEGTFQNFVTASGPVAELEEDCSRCGLVPAEIPGTDLASVSMTIHGATIESPLEAVNRTTTMLEIMIPWVDAVVFGENVARESSMHHYTRGTEGRSHHDLHPEGMLLPTVMRTSRGADRNMRWLP